MIYLVWIIALNLRAEPSNDETNHKGLNIDISYANSGPIANIKGEYTGPLIDVTLPVPFLYIRPSLLENVHQVAEAALENETIKAGTEDLYQEILSKLENKAPEEMITDLIANINQLEALKAELGTEERIARLKLSGKNTTPSTSLPVSYPVAINPNHI